MSAVRAGRLLNLLMLLQQRGRMTAGELARHLEVSERTILRDVESLSGAGVPVYAARGRHGGIELLDTFDRQLAPLATRLDAGRARRRSVHVRLSPAALRQATVLGAPVGWRRRGAAVVDGERWVDGSFRYDSTDAVVRELLALGPDVEVLTPPSVRAAMAAAGARIAELHRPAVS